MIFSGFPRLRINFNVRKKRDDIRKVARYIEVERGSTFTFKQQQRRRQRERH